MPKVVITRNNLPDILHRIEVWEGKLTWPLLCNEIMALLQVDGVTRQTLSGYKEIQEAYTARKQFLRENKSSLGQSSNAQPNDSNIDFYQNQVKSLEAELERANKIIERYKQRFVLWQYNAYRHGINIDSLDDALEMLEKPLSQIKRKSGGA